MKNSANKFTKYSNVDKVMLDVIDKAGVCERAWRRSLCWGQEGGGLDTRKDLLLKGGLGGGGQAHWMEGAGSYAG